MSPWPRGYSPCRKGVTLAAPIKVSLNLAGSVTTGYSYKLLHVDKHLNSQVRYTLEEPEAVGSALAEGLPLSQNAIPPSYVSRTAKKRAPHQGSGFASVTVCKLYQWPPLNLRCRTPSKWRLGALASSPKTPRTGRASDLKGPRANT